MDQILITWLHTKNKDLAEAYRTMRRTLITSTLLLLFLAIAVVVLVRCADKFFNDGISEIYPVATILVAYIAVQLYIRKQFSPAVGRFKITYKNAQDICNRIVDSADWSNFRLRELTNNKRSLVIDTVEQFYSIRNKRFFPARVDTSYFFRFRLAIMVLRMCIMSGILVYMVLSLFPTVRQFLYLR